MRNEPERVRVNRTLKIERPTVEGMARRLRDVADALEEASDRVCAGANIDKGYHGPHPRLVDLDSFAWHPGPGEFLFSVSAAPLPIESIPEPGR